MYAKSAAVAETHTQNEGVELLSELFEMAQQEYSDSKNIEGAINSAAEISPMFSELIDSTAQDGVTNQELAEVIENILTKWDVGDFAQFVPSGNDGQKQERSIQVAMNLFFSLAIHLSEHVYDTLQQQREEI